MEKSKHKPDTNGENKYLSSQSDVGESLENIVMYASVCCCFVRKLPDTITAESDRLFSWKFEEQDKVTIPRLTALWLKACAIPSRGIYSQ